MESEYSKTIEWTVPQICKGRALGRYGIARTCVKTCIAEIFCTPLVYCTDDFHVHAKASRVGAVALSTHVLC
jgi:hypothetical protein